MEALLEQFEKEDSYSLKIEKNYPNEQAVSAALAKFVDALRRCRSLLEKDQESKDDGGQSDINTAWLLSVCKRVPSELGIEQLARAVWDASHLQGEGNQQEALFAALGASDEAVTALFEIVPNLPQIKQNIDPSQLGGDGSPAAFNDITIIDQDELHRQRLRQEALDAAQVAAITQAEAAAASGPSRFGSTHTIRRKSEMKEQKLVQKANKKAAQALQRAKAAGAIIEESELLAVNDAGIGAGGLLGRSVDEVQALQNSLMPEGSRQYYGDQDLPSGTIREDDDIIGYERVTIPPPILDTSKLHPRLSIADILDQDCALPFSGTPSLNPMQSTTYDTAFNRRENMLVCGRSIHFSILFPIDFSIANHFVSACSANRSW